MNQKPNYQNSRRDFIKNSALATLGLVLLSRCTIDDFNACMVPNELSSDPDHYLDLPSGFTYKIISKIGDVMTDGFYVPGRADGMGTFQGINSGEVIIIRNHENSPIPLSNSPFGNSNQLLNGVSPNKLYDAGRMVKPGLGGTTTIIYNEDTQVIEKEYLSLAGTYRNCAGGVTPWNSWLSCEEDVTNMGGSAEKDHGYVFEVPASTNELVNPVPIKAMGRFNHEAVAVDPATSIVYMTEDRPDGLLYRYIPNIPENLAQGGRLQFLCIKDKPKTDTRNWSQRDFELNVEKQIKWIDINNPLAPNDDLRYRGFENGAARFARGEGIWFGQNELYFACTNGGSEQYGQIFRYKLSSDEGNEDENSIPATLELFVESTDRGVLNMCDNLTITPSGTLMVCEDNGDCNRILHIQKDGTISTFACNRSSDSEFAGIVFSPSGKTLFVNIQENGHTLAITGPWETIF